MERARATAMAEGDTADGEWEYRPVQLPGDVSRLTAAVRLAIQAEFGGWELARVRLYPGGVRKVVLRRRRSSRMLPELSIYTRKGQGPRTGVCLCDDVASLPTAQQFCRNSASTRVPNVSASTGTRSSMPWNSDAKSSSGGSRSGAKP